jgi:hypothetical protein
MGNIKRRRQCTNRQQYIYRVYCFVNGLWFNTAIFVDTDLPDDLMNWPLYDFLYCI